MKKYISLLLIYCMLFFTGCSSKNEDKIDEIISDTSVSSLVKDPKIKNMHSLDESLETLIFTETGETFAQIENNYYEAIKNGQSKQAEVMVSRMLKMIICAKLSPHIKYDAQTILDNIELPSIGEFDVGKSIVWVYVKDLKIGIEADEKDQFNRLILNYLNSILKQKGYERSHTASARYYALKSSILASEKSEKKDYIFNEPYIKIESDYSEAKIKALTKK